MASQQKIQEYLQRHKIGALFEELMGKIVVDQPDDPMRHLIGILQSKVDRKSEKVMLSKSVTTAVPARVRSGSPDRSKLAASFSGEKMLSEKDRQYNKPWLSHNRPMKSKTDSTDLTKSALKPGEKGSKMDLSIFDDIFEDAAPVKKASVMVIANKVEEATHPAFTRFQHSVNQVMIINRVQDGLLHQPTEEELLSAEVPISIRTITAAIIEELKTIDSSLGATAYSVQPVSRYNKGPKANALNHKKKLEEMVLLDEEQKKQKQKEISYDSGYDEHMSKDSAIELLEDVELLRMEGVANPKASGYKIRTVPTVDVKVSICARCARFLDGDLHQTSPVSPARVSSYGQLPSYPKGKESGSRPASGRGVPSPVTTPVGRLSPTEGFLTPRLRETPSPGPFLSDDEEFESVSQVTGPRHPVWQEEEEVMTPRKGSHMLALSGILTKPIRSSSHGEVTVGSRSQTKLASSGTLRNTGPVAGTQKPSSAARRNSFQLSDDENIVSSLAKNSSQWVVPDYDTDGSTVYVTGAGRSTSKNYKPRAY